MKTISVINQKGGVGKTTTALCIGAGLSLRGNKVLFVDIDPQGNLSYTMGADTSGRGAAGILHKPETARDEIQHTSTGDIIASTPALSGADAEITQDGKEYKLKDALATVAGEYDYCMIDTPPALGILTVNALTACNGVIIPAQADPYSLLGISQLNRTIETIREYCNPDLTVMGIVLTRYNGRIIIKREVAELLKRTAASLNTKLYKTKIRECIALVEAQARNQTIYDYSPNSNATADYSALVDEITEKE